MIRRLAFGLLLLPLLMVLVGCEGDLPEGAIAQVGTALISQDDFDELKAVYEAVGRAPDKDKQPDEYRSFERGLVEYLVTLEILRQEASTFSISITEQDVQASLGQIKQMFESDESKFEEALKKQNITLEQLTRSVGDRLWFDEMKAAVTNQVTVSDDEAKAYYEAHKAEYVKQESRDVRHILISPFPQTDEGTPAATATQAEWEAALVAAEKVRSEIQNGADFISETEKYSDDAATNESGGELGAVIRGQMDPAFEEAVFKLQKGELSEPVKTQYGYHLIEVTDITPAQQLAYDQVKENIKSSLLSLKQSDTWQEWLANMASKLGVVYRQGYKPVATTLTTVDAATTSTSSE